MAGIENNPLVSRFDVGFADGIATGRLSPEVIDAYEPALVIAGRGIRIVVGCGDKRPPTEESMIFVDQMTPDDTAPMADAYAGIFGAMIGETSIIAGAGMKKHGKSFLRAAGGIEGIKDAVFEARGARSTLHSDLKTEGHSKHFGFHKRSSEVGCFYNGTFGEIVHNGNRTDRAGDHIRAVAASDLVDVFGNANGVDELFRGFGVILDEVNGGKRYSFDRAKYIEQLKRGTPGVILESEMPSGGHASPLDTGVLLNMDIDRVGSPRIIREQDLPHLYRGDLSRVAYEISDVLKFFDIDPEDFLKIATIEATLVRATLADRIVGIPDPQTVPMGAIGNARDAIRILKKA